eukprot:821948_1
MNSIHDLESDHDEAQLVPQKQNENTNTKSKSANIISQHGLIDTTNTQNKPNCDSKTHPSQATFHTNSTGHPHDDSYSPFDENTRRMLHQVKQSIVALKSHEEEKARSILKLTQLEEYFKRESYEYDDIISDLNEKQEQSLIYAFCDHTLCDITIFHALHAFTSTNDATVHAKPHHGSTLDDLASNEPHHPSDADVKEDISMDKYEETDADAHADNRDMKQRSVELETEEYLQHFSDGELRSLHAILKETNVNTQSNGTHIANMNENEFDALLDAVLSHAEQNDTQHANVIHMDEEQKMKNGQQIMEALDANTREQKVEITNTDCEENTTRFTMKWQNIIHAIKQELYNKIAKRINKIVQNKKNAIDPKDLSEDTVNKVLNIASHTKHSIGKEEYVYIKQLVQRAARFKPYTQGFTRTTAQQTQLTPRRFSYRSDFDTKGLLYCLGTNGLVHRYQNPALKHIDVFSWPRVLLGGDITAFVGRGEKACITASELGAFVAVHLKNTKIRLTYYTLCYCTTFTEGGFPRARAPRNWSLQGSNDGHSWCTIQSHDDDASLKKQGDACTWKVDCTEYYSYFRIQSTGCNAASGLSNDIDSYSISLGGMELYGDAYGGSVLVNSEVHPRYPGLTIGILQDIYDVYRSFRYTNYFEDYKWETYVKEVMNEMYLELPNSHRDFNFNPTYVVNDDLFGVFQYIFGVSLYINQRMAFMSQEEIKLFVIGRSVQCIYDDKIVFPYNIDDVRLYLKQHNFHCGRCTVDDIDSVSKIVSCIEKARTRLYYATNPDADTHTKLNKKWGKNLLIIVDRRKDEDVIYVTEYKSFDRLSTLNCNYFVGMTIEILSGDNFEYVSAYLTYGIHEKLRFFPELLTSVVPRLFKASSRLNPYQYVSALYSPVFKQGFCLNLDTNINFNLYYKRITAVQHVSINYNRKCVAVTDYVPSKNKTEEMNNALESVCHVDNKLELAECIFITHVIESLQRFRACNYRICEQNRDTFDLNFLSKCYDHIISAHSFCFDLTERTKIQKFICNIIGSCPHDTPDGRRCAVLDNHASRARENRCDYKQRSNIMAKQEISDAQKEILSATMNSMHSYLVHTNAELFRLRNKDIDPGLRFTTATEAINEGDEESKSSNRIEIDHLNTFLRNVDITDRALSKFNDWCKVNEYDSDALNEDILYKNDSYLFAYFQANKLGIFFDLMIAKYVEDDTEVSQKDFNSLNFGISVLNWLDHNEKPTHKNLKDELLA